MNCVIPQSFLYCRRSVNADEIILVRHAHGANPSALVPMFDKLLRSTYIYADQMSIWNADYEATDSKMSAMMAEIDEDGRNNFLFF